MPLPVGLGDQFRFDLSELNVGCPDLPTGPELKDHLLAFLDERSEGWPEPVRDFVDKVIELV